MLDQYRLKRLLTIIYRYNLKHESHRFKFYEQHLKWIVDKTLPDDPEKFELVTQNKVIATFASKKVLLRKVGDAQAVRIFGLAKKRGYLDMADSAFSTLNETVDLTDDGDKLRTTIGMVEKIYEDYPHIMRVLLGGGTIVLGIQLFDIIVATLKHLNVI